VKRSSSTRELALVEEAGGHGLQMDVLVGGRSGLRHCCFRGSCYRLTT